MMKYKDFSRLHSVGGVEEEEEKNCMNTNYFNNRKDSIFIFIEYQLTYFSTVRTSLKISGLIKSISL